MGRSEEPSASGGSGRRILYLQYTNPAAYPPLEHSSRILAEAGWSVRFVGTAVHGLESMEFPPHPNLEVRLLPACEPGWRQKLHYLRFVALAVGEVLRWRPAWVYVSDTLAAPAGWLVRRLAGTRLVYHEHDSPPPDAATPVMRLALAARRRLAAAAELCVLPNAERARRLVEQVGPVRELHTVWNCPRVEETAPAPHAPHAGPVRVLYHGSVVPVRLPLSIMAALARVRGAVELTVIGYETLGSEGYIDALRREAERHGVADRVRFLGAMPRHELMRAARRCDLGLCFMPGRTDDINMREMIGASNKAFDYLGAGLALLVSELPAWRAFFVDAGLARAADPEDPASLAAALQWFADHPAELRAMGERGRQRVLAEWNYQAQFREVLARLEAPPGRAVTPPLATPAPPVRPAR